MEDTAAPEAVVPGPAPAPTGESTAGKERVRGPALSPSRAADFMTCPLLYRFRVIDKLPEPPSPAAARGTLVHAVLERLFDHPRPERTPDAAHALVLPEWERLAAAEPELTTLFDGPEELQTWLKDAGAAGGSHFRPG